MQSKTVFSIASELVENLSRYPMYLRPSKSPIEKKRRSVAQSLMKRKIRILTNDLSESLAVLRKN